MTKADPNALCRAKNCSRPVNAKGLCKSHYDMRRLSDPEKRAIAIAQGRAWHAAHREEANARSRVYYHTVNKTRQADQLRLRKFGLTQANFDALLAEQGAACAICQSRNPRGRGTFHVDHCHDTGRIRGLLCTTCNSGLGHFKDDPARLEAAAAYLRRHH